MKLDLHEPPASYTSNAQRARIQSERWVAEQAYCPACGNGQVTQFAANLPVADFFCPSCNEQYELKSQKSAFGARIVDGAYRTMRERLLSAANPHLLLLNYDLAGASVKNVCVVPNTSSFSTSSKNGSPSPRGRNAPAGSAATFC